MNAGPTTNMLRIDQWLFQNKFARSRTHALALIDALQVEVFDPESKTWTAISKGSLKVSENFERSRVRIQKGPADRYVSRGGLKLEGALQHLGSSRINLTGIRVLDVGVSTGGFSDCCLQLGAREVVGIDVGHGQIDPSLLDHPHFRHFEGLNARELSTLKSQIEALNEPFNLIVGDVSFISMTSIIPELRPLLFQGGAVLFLVKPQFELDRRALNKKGLVKEPASYELVKEKIINQSARHQLKVIDYFESSIEGKDGNREFFIFAIAE